MLHVPREDWLNHRDSMNGQLDFLRRPANSNAANQSVSTVQPGPTKEKVKQDSKGCQTTLIVIIVVELIIIIGGGAIFGFLSTEKSSSSCGNMTFAEENPSQIIFDAKDTQDFKVRSTIKGQSISNIRSVSIEKYHNIHPTRLGEDILSLQNIWSINPDA